MDCVTPTPESQLKFSISLRVMAPRQIFEIQRKDSQRKGLNHLGIRMLELNVPPGWLLGVSPPHYIIGRARADTHAHTHIPRHTASSGGRARTDTHSLTHPPTLSQTGPNLPTVGFRTAEFLSKVRFQSSTPVTLAFL